MCLKPRTVLFSFTSCFEIHTKHTDYFHSRTVHLDIIKVFYLPTDAQVCCLKKQY